MYIFAMENNACIESVSDVFKVSYSCWYNAHWSSLSVSTCFGGGDIYIENTSCHVLFIMWYLKIRLPYTCTCVLLNVLCLYILYDVVSEIKQLITKKTRDSKRWSETGGFFYLHDLFLISTIHGSDNLQICKVIKRIQIKYLHIKGMSTNEIHEYIMRSYFLRLAGF